MIDLLQFFGYPFVYGWLVLLLIYVVIFRFLKHWELSERLALITGLSMVWFSSLGLTQKNPYEDIGRVSSFVMLGIGTYLIYRRLEARKVVEF